MNKFVELVNTYTKGNVKLQAYQCRRGATRSSCRW